MRRSPVILGGLAVLLLVILAAAGAWFLRPRLLNVTPAAGSTDVPAASRLELTFSQPLQMESLTSRLQIEPPQTGAYAWQGNTLVFTPDQLWSGGTTITVTLQGGALAEGWLPLPLLEKTTWSFSVSLPRLAYLYPYDAPADLYILDLQSGEIARQTRIPGGVLDYSASPDGRYFYLSTLLAGLQRLDRLSGELLVLEACSEAICRLVQPAPGGDYLAYERTPDSAASLEGYPQVWLLPLTGGEPFLADADAAHSVLPLWSAGGRLAYYDAIAQEFVLLDLASGARQRFANTTGEPGAWSADGAMLIAPEIILQPNGYMGSGGEIEPLITSHLLGYSQAGEPPLDLTGAPNLEDVTPSAAPDGRWLAFGRKFLDPQRWTPGRQLWLLNLETGETVSLSDAPFYSHFAIQWSPDSAQVAYVRTNQTLPTEPPEIWISSIDGLAALRVITGGFDPLWVP